MSHSIMTIGASGMKAQDYNLRAVAQNIAITNVVGAKSQRADFQEQAYQILASAGSPVNAAGTATPEGTQLGTGVMFSGTTTDFSQGPLKPTNNPLEMAINGEGWFVVEKDGQQLLTRDGRFKVDANGLLVTSEGYPVVPNITIPKGSTQVSISQNGIISALSPGQTTPTAAGSIQIALVANNGGMMRLGKGLWSTTTSSGDLQQNNPGENGAGTIQGSCVEEFNGSLIDSMMEMISAQKAYEANSKSVQAGEEILSIINNIKK